jgi:hypothetical protein
VTTNEVSLLDALDLMVFCNHQGQIDQKSDFETRLYQDLLNQIFEKIEDSKKLCFIWMYLRSCGPSACQSLGKTLTESITEDDYNRGVIQIIDDPEKKSCDEDSEGDILELIRKIHMKLKNSPISIMPFTQSCTSEIRTVKMNAGKWILEWDKFTAYHALVEGGSFRKTDYYGFARATETMNSKCSNNFRWSIRLADGIGIYIGIASKLRINSSISDFDENSIFYAPHVGKIRKGNTVIRRNIIKAKKGDEIHFRFQPKLKKFTISFKDEVHDVDIKEDVDYFPVIQGTISGASATLFKPQED